MWYKVNIINGIVQADYDSIAEILTIDETSAYIKIQADGNKLDNYIQVDDSEVATYKNLITTTYNQTIDNTAGNTPPTATIV